MDETGNTTKYIPTNTSQNTPQLCPTGYTTLDEINESLDCQVNITLNMVLWGMAGCLHGTSFIISIGLLIVKRKELGGNSLRRLRWFTVVSCLVTAIMGFGVVPWYLTGTRMWSSIWFAIFKSVGVSVCYFSIFLFSYYVKRLYDRMNIIKKESIENKKYFIISLFVAWIIGTIINISSPFLGTYVDPWYFRLYPISLVYFSGISVTIFVYFTSKILKMTKGVVDPKRVKIFRQMFWGGIFIAFILGGSVIALGLISTLLLGGQYIADGIVYIGGSSNCIAIYSLLYGKRFWSLIFQEKIITNTKVNTTENPKIQ